MKQLGQKLKTGEMRIIEVPVPKPGKKEILVQCHFSIISAGTESSTVTTARKSYIGKAKERPQQVKQVFDTLKSQGPVQTYRAVMKKLDAYSPLGYSCAGSVVEIGDQIKEFQIGDLVACGGFSASHSEFVAVPNNLCTKLEPSADLSVAAYNTLGAIALQGVRQADLRIGETCAVIGLGLIGQLTALILKASGVRTIGIDISEKIVEIGKAQCLDLGLSRNAPGVESQCITFADGLGCDAVIITAGTDSLDPINFAGAIARKKGKVVIVGAVPAGFDREPFYYKKELQIKMSCSYGPGRYDPIYEEKGIDYPAAYVRWTEKRNMQAFQRLIFEKKINLKYLTTHTFKLDDAPEAYNLILQKEEFSIGVLIAYDYENSGKNLFRKISLNIQNEGKLNSKKHVGIGFIGAGSYAMNHLVPNLMKHQNAQLVGVMTTTGHTSRSVAERAGFDFATTDEKEIWQHKKIDTVFIATRHDTHFQYVLDALKNKKHVFVEKPLCLNIDQVSHILDQLEKNYNENIYTKIMVGYNRRFSPIAKSIKNWIPKGPIAVVYRINAGSIPSDTWIQDNDMGGGRIIGEVCHFIDFITFLTDSLVQNVYAVSMKDSNNTNDTVSITMRYNNGSIGTINYFANGDNVVPKEHIEIFCNGCIGRINDFKGYETYQHGKKKSRTGLVQNKGQENEIKSFIDCIKNSHDNPISIKEIINTSIASFGAVESLRTGQPFHIGIQ